MEYLKHNFRMIKNSMLAMIFFISSFSINAQHKTYQNFELVNPVKTELTSLLNSYINSEVAPEEIFSKHNIEKYKTIDIMKESLSLGGSLYSITFDANILSIKNEGENYIVQAMLYWHNSDSKEKPITVLGIMNFRFVKDEGNWKITNYVDYHTQNWSTQKVGNITYIYYPEYPFDKRTAQNAVDFYQKLSDTFGIKKPAELTYYIAKNCDEINLMSGFEYFISEGSNSNICAFIDDKNNIIYSTATFGEGHLHEIIHTLNKHFPSANTYMLIGLSAYINDAGSRGSDMLFHIKRFQEYTLSNNLDFEKFEDFENMDDYTNISYVTGTLLCNAIYRKGGLSLLKSYLQNTEDISVFKNRLKKEFKIKSFETFFKNEIDFFIKQKRSLFYIE